MAELMLEYRLVWCRDLTLAGLCRCCRRPLMGRRTANCSKPCAEWFQDNHFWNTARTVALRRNGRNCVRCGANGQIEVDHIVPVAGGVRWLSCHNHQANLQALCLPCHQRKTARDRARARIDIARRFRAGREEVPNGGT